MYEKEEQDVYVKAARTQLWCKKPKQIKQFPVILDVMMMSGIISLRDKEF